MCKFHDRVSRCLDSSFEEKFMLTFLIHEVISKLSMKQNCGLSTAVGSPVNWKKSFWEVGNISSGSCIWWL